ncbi:flavohemoprotein [Streptomyces termitum]|uniref:nitric oxide dioxygenase n=1 Tax=Streptomyces termitum TaxID=67368 RepID=A0A918T601_9ACTN|nr:flavohemoprotein [Streptomyces termitum]
MPRVDLALLRSAFAVVERRAEHTVTYFYAHLFHRNPRVRALFPADLAPQRDRLFAVLAEVVARFDDPGLPGYLGRLGRDHRRFLATPALYAAVGESLLAAFAQTAGAAWTVEAEKAWTEAYARITELMLRGAEESVREGEPPWWEADVVRHERYGGDLAVLTLRPRRPYRHRPGQYAGVASPRVPRAWRTYSLAAAPRPDGTVELHVSRVRGGATSTALVTATRPGDVLRLSAPGGGLVSRTPPGAPRTYIGAGTGWAPVKALLEEAAETDPGARGRVFAVARSRELLYGRADLERLAARLPGLRVTYIAAAPRHPRAQATERLLTALRSRGGWADHDVYLAGPPGLLAETAEVLAELGTDPARVRHDALPPVRRPAVRALSPAERLLLPPPARWHDPAARTHLALSDRA